MVGTYTFLSSEVSTAYSLIFVHVTEDTIKFLTFDSWTEGVDVGDRHFVDASQEWPGSGLTGMYVARTSVSYHIDDFRRNKYFRDGAMYGLNTERRALYASDRDQDERRYGMLLCRQLEGYFAGLFVPDTECSFDECLLVVGRKFGEREIAVLSNQPLEDLPNESVFERIAPSLNLEGGASVPAGGTAELKLSVTDNARNLDSLYWIYADCDNGGLNVRRFKLGVGESRMLLLSAAGLQAGDAVTVRAGIEADRNFVSHVLRVE